MASVWALPRKCCPGSFAADRVERLAVLGQVDALDEDGHHPALVGVEDELLVADGQPALEPAGGVEHEVDAAEDGRLERRRRSRRRPGRRRSSSAHSEPPERNGTPSRRASAAMTYRTSAGSGVPNVGAPDCIDIELRERAEDDRRAGPDELDERHAGERLGEGLGADAGRGHRAPSRRRG